jgi:hypothetical protein
MAEIKDYIKLIAEVIVLLMIFSVVFGEEGIASTTYNYLVFVEPTLLQDFIASSIIAGSQAPGEFSSTFSTTGQPHTIKVFEENGINYVQVIPAEEVYLRTQYYTLDPSPVKTECTVQEKTIELQRDIKGSIIVRKVMDNGSCKIYVEASEEVLKEEVGETELIIGEKTNKPTESQNTEEGDGDTSTSETNGNQYSIYALSGSASDIQAAVDQAEAAGGGDVYIPAGTWNFVEVGEPWKTVGVPLGVNIFGAPNNRDANGQNTEWNTVLVMPYDVEGTWFNLGKGGSSYPTFDPDVTPRTQPIRFSDIKLQGYRSIDPESDTRNTGIVIYGVPDFRIDHSCFENTAGSAVTVQAWYDEGLYSHGVIDHNRIYNTHGWDDLANYVNGNTDYGIELHRVVYGSDFSQWEPTESVLGKYTDYTVFIEDNYFSKWRHVVSSGHGAYYVFRYNTVDQDWGHFSVDVHGLRDSEPERLGGRGAEIYENTFTNCNPSDDSPSGGSNVRGLFQNGGGCGVWFNNYVDNTYNSIVLYNEDAVPSPTCHLKDFYLWSSKGSWTPYVSYPSGSIDPSRNVLADWSRQAGNPNDSNYPNVDPSWSISYYKPYTYPHPLTG